MDEKIPELLDLTRKLLDQSMRIFNDSLIDNSVPAKEVRYSIFLRAQMSETLKFGYGAYYSCYHSWGHGGIGAARSIYEILLDIKYINQDKEERFARFFDHGTEYLYRKMERIRESGQTVSQKEQDRYTDAYDQLKRKYNDKHKQETDSGIKKADATPRYSPLNWAGLSITQKVRVVNLEQFHQLYKDLANLSHVSVEATLDAITGFTENQIEVDLSLHPSRIHCSLVLMVIFTCIAGILEEYMKYFGICYSRSPALEAILEDYKELLNR